MINFEFVSPTKYIFGRDAETRIGRAVRELGGHRVLLVYGSRRSDTVIRIRALMEAEGIDVAELPGVVPNARLESVYQGIKLAKEEQADFIVGAGGGSVIDTAKGVAMGFYYEGDVWDFYSGKAVPEKALPVAAVVTLAGAGSESSRVSVITHEREKLKKPCASDLIRPVLAVLNPALAFTAPGYVLACSAYDIVSHVFERYFSPSTDVDLTDRLCEGVMTAAIRAGIRAFDDSSDYEAQATLMWAAPIAQSDFLSAGRLKDGVCHNIEHEIGALYDVPHGAGLSAIFTAWAKYVYQSNIPRFAQYAQRVWNCDPDGTNPEKTALKGIQRTMDYIHRIGLPANLFELGIGEITDGVIKDIALRATNGGLSTMGGIRVLNTEDIIRILHMAKHGCTLY